MSRKGKLPVIIPGGVTVGIQGQKVEVKGPKGNLTQSFDKAIRLKQEGDLIIVEPANSSRLAKDMYGTARSIIFDMVEGVVNGYSKNLEIKGVGFRAALKGTILELKLGFSHDISYELPEGVIVTVTENTKIKVEGADKQVVGQVAADIFHYSPAEPYKKKGVHILGNFVRYKEGKKTA